MRNAAANWYRICNEGFSLVPPHAALRRRHKLGAQRAHTPKFGSSSEGLPGELQGILLLPRAPGTKEFHRDNLPHRIPAGSGCREHSGHLMPPPCSSRAIPGHRIVATQL